MKKLIILSLFTLFSLGVCAFEGVIHCAKIENGSKVEFKFYVKEDKISVIANDGVGKYKIILNRSSKEMLICMDHPQFEKKGFYRFNASDIEKNFNIEVIKQMETDAIRIDGELCKGYTIVTNDGIASAYLGPEKVNLTGFSTFLNDPVYELIDRLKLQNLPRKLVVSKSTSSYVIEMKAEEKSLDAEVFAIPEGYVEFKVSTPSAQ